MSHRVVLAGADPAEALTRTGAEVIALLVDVGAGPGTTRERALAEGAVAVAVETVDAREEFAQRYCLPALLANAAHQDHGPLLAWHAVAAARRYGATAVAGASPHFATAVQALAPDLTVLPGHDRPEWTNLWRRAVRPAPAADPEHVVITFDRGVPVALDGETYTVRQVLQELNRRAGGHGIGRAGAHETPGATTLVTAHRALEALTLPRELRRAKRDAERRWAELAWFSAPKHALDEFVLGTQEHVSGQVRVLLADGRAVVTERRSEGDTFGQSLARGFAQLWSLPSKIAAKRDLHNQWTGA